MKKFDDSHQISVNFHSRREFLEKIQDANTIEFDLNAKIIELPGGLLIQTQSGFKHYCAACNYIHPLPTEWTFNNNYLSPSFNPSFKQILHDYYDSRINTIVKQSGICHYTITDGQIIYHSDCTHVYKNKSVPMEKIPEYFTLHFL